ncbi:hypothetical protein J542_0835 [Acinetobacter baumannii 299505]|nr:hypothetical protein J542_0835 [Acinetobacter baumannii 299505]
MHQISPLFLNQVHGGIRHLEIKVYDYNGNELVHGGIRHLEMMQMN